jgi:hypothetical protein
MHHPRDKRVWKERRGVQEDVVLSLVDAVEFEAEVAEIVLADVEVADLVDNGK